MHPTRAAPLLGEEDVALGAEGGQVLLERPHTLPNAADAPFELSLAGRAQVFSHKPRR